MNATLTARRPQIKQIPARRDIRRNLDAVLVNGKFPVTATGRSLFAPDSGAVLVSGKALPCLSDENTGLVYHPDINDTKTQGFLSYLWQKGYVEFHGGKEEGRLYWTVKFSEYAAKVRPGYSYWNNSRGEGDKSPLEMLYKKYSDSTEYYIIRDRQRRIYGNGK